MDGASAWPVLQYRFTEPHLVKSKYIIYFDFVCNSSVWISVSFSFIVPANLRRRHFIPQLIAFSCYLYFIDSSFSSVLKVIKNRMSAWALGAERRAVDTGYSDTYPSIVRISDNKIIRTEISCAEIVFYFRLNMQKL